MISIEELKYTINRLELLKNNSDNPEESVMVELLNTNLKNMVQQLEGFSKTNEFKQLVKEKSNNDISES